MFSKKINHPQFKELNRDLFDYTGKIDILNYKDIEISIRSRKTNALERLAEELNFIKRNLGQFQNLTAEEAFSAYEGMKDVVECGDFGFERYGEEFPVIDSSMDVWDYMVLEDIIFEPKSKYQIRLGFGCY